MSTRTPSGSTEVTISNHRSTAKSSALTELFVREECFAPVCTSPPPGHRGGKWRDPKTSARRVIGEAIRESATGGFLANRLCHPGRQRRARGCGFWHGRSFQMGGSDLSGSACMAVRATIGPLSDWQAPQPSYLFDAREGGVLCWQ